MSIISLLTYCYQFFIFFIVIINLRIASYNVNGLHNLHKCDKITQWSKLFNVDILILQETFFNLDSDYRHFKDQWRGRFVFSPSLNNKSGGVCIAFKENLQISISSIKCDNSGRLISIICNYKGQTFRICNIHAPSSPSDRSQFFYEYL